MRINLLPEQYRPEPLINPFRLTLLIVCSILVFGGAVWLLIQSFQLKTEEELLATVNQQVDSYQGTLREISAYEQRLQSLTQRLTQVEKIKTAYFQYPLVLKRLAGALEEDMWFNSVDMTALGQFNVAGRTLIFPRISGLLKNLQSVPELQEVKLTQVSAIEENELDLYNFTIKLKPEGGEPGNAQAQNQ
ncbi:MAG TPA: PilN domain-containing protein [Bacillota bacterium]|nr:PilN domain-containing protein [Bacillota bacterium]